MTDFDHELIAAVAEGTLPANEAADLEARIAADPVASAELEAQRAALAALAAATPPRLDDLERRRLHRSVADELDLVLPEPATRRTRRWPVNWSALATAAAVLLGVALAAPLLSLLNTSDSSGDATTTVVAAADSGEADLESLAVEEAPAETEAPRSDLEAASAPAEDAAPAATTTPPDTTFVAETTTADAGGDERFAAYESLVDFGELDEELSEPRTRLQLGAVPGDDVDGDGAAEPPPCVAEVRAELSDAGAPETTTVSVLGRGTFGGVPVYVLTVAEDDVVRQLRAVDLAGCSTLGAATVG